MIYQVGIGEYDNCYIITGGITGLTEFNPVLVNSNSEAVSIIIDRKDDTIFTPWIKQSLKVNLLKENESDFAEIIAGDDNTTYGILIENGELELVGSDLQITNGGKLKFIGTLALESYSEQYRAVSVVQFTFNDRIGVLSEKYFYNELPYLPITRIFAELLHDISCSKLLRLEWPYAIDTDDDPSHFFIDVKEFFGNNKLSFIEDLLFNFGLQLLVDFEDNPQTKLVDCGCLKIRSVNNVTDQTVTYWELSLYIGTIYNYAGTLGTEEGKVRNLINSDVYPLINNEAILNMERMAKNIVAKTETIQIPILWGGDIDKKFIDYDIDTDFKFVPFALIESENIADKIKDVLFYRNLYGLKHIKLDQPFNKLGIPVGNSSGGNWSVVISQPIVLIKGIIEPTTLKFKLDFSAAVIDRYGRDDLGGQFRISIIKYDGSNYYIWNNDDTWVLFTSSSQVNQGTTALLDYLYVNGEYVSNYGTFTIDFSTDIVYMLAITYTEFSGPLNTAHIERISLANRTVPSIDFVLSETLTTVLNANNRKDVEIAPKILNCPNVYGMDLEMANLIMDSYYNRPETIVYKGLSQTILAHLSDQYGWQYKYNRWNIEGTTKAIADSFNLMGQFGLEDKILILLSGEYNAKSKILKGKWGQVLEIGDNAFRLLDDNFIPFTWDDGNYIMLN